MGGNEDDVPGASEGSFKAPEAQTPEIKEGFENVEAPVAGLPERFARLRSIDVGKPIVIGNASENGVSVSEPTFVGHILPVSENNDDKHLVLLDNGMAIVVGKRGISYDHDAYDSYFNGSEPLIYPEGTTKEGIFAGIAGKKDFSAGLYPRSDRISDPNKEAELKRVIEGAMKIAEKRVAERVSLRVNLAGYTADLIDKAFTPRADTVTSVGTPSAPSGSAPTA